QVLRARVSWPVGAGDEEQVGPAVAVVVEDGDAAAHRLGHPLVAFRAVDVREVDPAGGGLLLEPQNGRRRSPRGEARRLDGLRLFLAAPGEEAGDEAHGQRDRVGATERQTAFPMVPSTAGVRPAAEPPQVSAAGGARLWPRAGSARTAG